MKYLSQNLKYLLMKKGIKRSEWVDTLVSSLSCGKERAHVILEGRSDKFNQGEIEALVSLSGVDFERLETENLLQADEVDVFSTNISFLIERLPHGKKKDLAKSLGVDQTTISRWNKGTQRPTKSKVKDVIEYFNLPKTIDLEKDPIFLSTMPIGETETKEWIKEKIESLDRERIRELAPTFIMLLKRSD